MAQADGTGTATPLCVTRVRSVRWSVDAVAEGGVLLGYLSPLPEGLWLAYHRNGVVGRTYQRRWEALAALRAAAAAYGSVQDRPRRGW